MRRNAQPYLETRLTCFTLVSRESTLAHRARPAGERNTPEGTPERAVARAFGVPDRAMGVTQSRVSRAGSRLGGAPQRTRRAAAAGWTCGSIRSAGRSRARRATRGNMTERSIRRGLQACASQRASIPIHRRRAIGRAPRRRRHVERSAARCRPVGADLQRLPGRHQARRTADARRMSDSDGQDTGAQGVWPTAVSRVDRNPPHLAVREIAARCACVLRADLRTPKARGEERHQAKAPGRSPPRETD